MYIHLLETVILDDLLMKFSYMHCIMYHNMIYIIWYLACLVHLKTYFAWFRENLGIYWEKYILSESLSL